MSVIDCAIICQFIQDHFHKRATSVRFIGSGMFSQAFSFTVDRQAFVFRVNAYEEDFKKDAFAYQHFCAPTLPIPQVVRIGRFDETRYFAITERCSGLTLKAMDLADVRNVVPRLFDTLGAIHHTDVSGYAGWGLTDASGNGLFETWQDYLNSLYNQKFAFEWSELAQNTFLERDVFETLLEAMKELLPYCPAEKYLVHGDFGFDNVMSDGEKMVLHAASRTWWNGDRSHNWRRRRLPLGQRAHALGFAPRQKGSK